MEITAAVAMDRMYRQQRHVYDVTRRYYLLGRDQLIRRLAPARGRHVLEIGCGTGRNLVRRRAALQAARNSSASIFRARCSDRAGAPSREPDWSSA